MATARQKPVTAPSPPGPLRGHLDAVLVSDNFIQVCGWVCTLDKRQAETPLRFTVKGKSFGGFGLNMRQDLAEAGIADGNAFFDVVLPIDDGELGVAYDVQVTDAVGAACSIYYPAHSVARFMPSGAIDEVGARVITGWVFDPQPSPGAGAAAFYLGDEFMCHVRPSIDRSDLCYDLGLGQKAYGYEIPGETLSRTLDRLEPRYGRGDHTLILASSGYALASVALRRDETGAISLLNAAKPRAPTAPVLASDFLDCLMSPQLAS
jgi:hypothetical protein